MGIDNDILIGYGFLLEDEYYKKIIDDISKNRFNKKSIYYETCDSLLDHVIIKGKKIALDVYYGNSNGEVLYV